ncbi:MAG: ribonuclease E [Gammaproteobacteria bacterium]|nr:ribonuclease E [Gammaproteobacteria bacterium]
MKRMLVNATQPEELRVAMVDGQRLYNLDIESPSRSQKKGNIYKGRVTRVEPSLEAAFVDFGVERHGFLPLKEIARSYFSHTPEPGNRINIKEVIKEGQDVIVQVDKEERGNKGAALTTFVSLAGRFLVLMPNNPRAGGVSRRIGGDDRNEIRETLAQLEIPEDMGIIVRTAGVSRSAEELQWDLDYLRNIWSAIEKTADRSGPFLIYQESNAILRAIRDHLDKDIGEVLIDDETVYNEARQFMETVMPHNVRRLKFYEDQVPLFTRFQIESQIESAFAHSVRLPAGGSVVIDPTEALVSIDINSARATKGEDIEQTALNTNLEAADEIARQLRLRDIGGLVVIDFIDMSHNRNQREVENRLREAVRSDRARVQIGRISRFGLLEMSRQRLRPSLGESSAIVCPRCNGQGTVRDVESLALAILRLIGEEARKERTARVVARLPVDVSTYLLNEKRDWVNTIEQKCSVHVVLVPDPDLETPNYSIRRIRDDEASLPENTAASYLIPDLEEEPADNTPTRTQTAAAPQAAVQVVVPEGPAPTPAPAPAAATVVKAVKPGLFVRMWRALFASGDAEDTSEKKPRSKQDSGKPQARNRRRGQAQGNNQGNNQGRSQGGRKRTRKSSPQRRRKPATGGKKPDTAAAGQADSGSAEKNTENTNKPRRRRRRGGRRRGGQRKNVAQQETPNNKKESSPGDKRDGSRGDNKSGHDKSSKPAQASDDRRNKSTQPGNEQPQPAKESAAKAPEQAKKPAPKTDHAGDKPKQGQQEYTAWSATTPRSGTDDQ